MKNTGLKNWKLRTMQYLILLVLAILLVSFFVTAFTDKDITDSKQELSKLINSALRGAVNEADTIEKLDAVNQKITTAQSKNIDVDQDILTLAKKKKEELQSNKESEPEKKSEEESFIGSTTGKLSIGAGIAILIFLIVFILKIVKGKSLKKEEKEAATVLHYLMEQDARLSDLEVKKHRLIEANVKATALVESIESFVLETQEREQLTKKVHAELLLLNKTFTIIPKNYIFPVPLNKAEQNLNDKKSELSEDTIQMIIGLKTTLDITGNENPSDEDIKKILVDREKRKRLLLHLENNIEELEFIIEKEKGILSKISHLRKKDLASLEKIHRGFLKDMDENIDIEELNSKLSGVTMTDTEKSSVTDLSRKENPEEHEIQVLIKHMVLLIRELQEQVKSVNKEVNNQIKEVAEEEVKEKELEYGLIGKQKSKLRLIKKANDKYNPVVTTNFNNILADEASLVVESQKLRNSWNLEASFIKSLRKTARDLAIYQEMLDRHILILEEQRKKDGVPVNAPLRNSIILNKDTLENDIKENKIIEGDSNSWKTYCFNLKEIYDKNILLKTKEGTLLGKIPNKSELQKFFNSHGGLPYTMAYMDLSTKKTKSLHLRKREIPDAVEADVIDFEIYE